MQPKPLLTEMLCHHLCEFKVDVIHVPSQLVDAFLFFEQSLWLSGVYFEFVC